MPPGSLTLDGTGRVAQSAAQRIAQPDAAAILIPSVYDI